MWVWRHIRYTYITNVCGDITTLLKMWPFNSNLKGQIWCQQSNDCWHLKMSCSGADLAPGLYLCNIYPEDTSGSHSETMDWGVQLVNRSFRFLGGHLLQQTTNYLIFIFNGGSFKNKWRNLHFRCSAVFGLNAALVCTGSFECTKNLVISFISEPRSELRVGGRQIKLGKVISESHPVWGSQQAAFYLCLLPN